MRYQILWDFLESNCYYILLIWLLMAFLVKIIGNKKLSRIFMALSSIIYIAVVLYITLFSRYQTVYYDYKLKLFWEHKKALNGSKHWQTQIFNNIILFLPLGYLYREDFANSKRVKKFIYAVLIGFLTSFCIETIQLVFRVGMFEYDDMVNNTVGMALGYILSALESFIIGLFRKDKSDE